MDQKVSKILLAILAAGTLLRLIALEARDVHFDEAFSYHIAKLPLKDILAAALTDNNPPAYYLLLHFFLNIGEGETILRLPSFIAGLVLIFIVFNFIKKRFGPKTGLAAAGFLSLSPLTIYLSTEARLHSLAILTTTLTAFSFLHLLKQQNLRSELSFVVAATAGFYTQLYTILIFVPFTIIAFSQRNVIRLKLFKILTIPLVLFSPWVFLALNSAHNACWCPNALLSLPASIVSPAVAGIGIVTLRFFPSLPLWILALFFLTSATTILLFLKGILVDKNLSYLYLLPLVAISLAGLIFPVFSPKAFSVYSPLILSVAAIGAVTYFQKWLVPLIFLLLTIISTIQVVNPFFQGEKLKQAYTITQTTPNIPIIHTSLASYYSFRYYSQDQNQNILINNNPLSASTIKFIGGQKEDVPRKANKIWLVDTDKWTEPNKKREKLRVIFNDFNSEENYHESIFQVYLLKRR